jgi:hypothetical protein
MTTLKPPLSYIPVMDLHIQSIVQIRVAKYVISSVISIMDDELIENERFL